MRALLATPLEVMALNGAINFTLQYAHCLPPEGRAVLAELQKRLIVHLPAVPPAKEQERC
ncbi:MAG: hypothetical protein IMW89_04740 [Ktedonobacteraceae bacterium]|nr:hypothetical protein [Ktedonobacteraceae bacterium]